MSKSSPSPQRLFQPLLQALKPPDLGRFAVRGLMASIPGWAAAAAIWTFGAAQRDPLEGAETLYLAGLCGWVLIWAALASADAGRRCALIATACVATVWISHGGPHRGGWISGLLALALLLGAVELWRQPFLESQPGLRLRGFFAWSVAWQGLFHSAQFLDPWSPALGLDLLLWPAIATLMLGFATHWIRGAVGLWGALIAVACFGPWSPWALAALGSGLVLWSALSRRASGIGRVQSPFFSNNRRWARFAGFLAFLPGLWLWLSATSVGYPWFQSRPPVSLSWWSGAWSVETLHHGAGVILTAESSSLELSWNAEGAPVTTVMLETDLVHGAGLPPGTPVLEVWLRSAGPPPIAPLTVLGAGVDTDDWAAGRADLLAVQGRPKVPVWRHQVAPDGSFFSRIYRSSIDLPVVDGSKGQGLELRRPAGLPDDVQVRVHRAEVWR